MEPKALCMISKLSGSELHAQISLRLLKIYGELGMVPDL